MASRRGTVANSNLRIGSSGARLDDRKDPVLRSKAGVCALDIWWCALGVGARFDVFACGLHPATRNPSIVRPFSNLCASAHSCKACYRASELVAVTIRGK